MNHCVHSYLNLSSLPPVALCFDSDEQLLFDFSKLTGPALSRRKRLRRHSLLTQSYHSLSFCLAACFGFCHRCLPLTAVACVIGGLFPLCLSSADESTYCTALAVVLPSSFRPSLRPWRPGLLTASMRAHQRTVRYVALLLRVQPSAANETSATTSYFFPASGAG